MFSLQGIYACMEHFLLASLQNEVCHIPKSTQICCFSNVPWNLCCAVCGAMQYIHGGAYRVILDPRVCGRYPISSYHHL